jgi:hypothetical protein
MMQNYPDQKQHIEQYIEKSAMRVVAAMQETGIQPTPTLIKAIAEQTIDEAEESFQQECNEILAGNIALMLQDHKHRMDQIKRDGLRMALISCIPVAIIFLSLAGIGIGQGQIGIAVMFAVAALAFVGMLVYAILDQPKAGDEDDVRLE